MPDVHALLSASSSKQWLHCPPSVRLAWAPGTPFPEGIGARIPDLELASLPSDQGSLSDPEDYGETLETEDPSVLAGFFDLDGGDA